MHNVMLDWVVPALHVAACVFLIVVVLLQTGKGADMGAVFGGGSQTLFGSSGAGNFLTKLTTGTAIAFMITSLVLTYGGRRAPNAGLFEKLPSVDETAPPAVPPPGAGATAPGAGAVPAPAAGTNAPAPGGQANANAPAAGGETNANAPAGGPGANAPAAGGPAAPTPLTPGEPPPPTPNPQP
jgi:preprotein translocase subunit SecG